MINIHGKVDSSYRYKMPKLETQVRKNNKTYVTNLTKIAASLNRPANDLLKWFSTSLAVSSNQKDVSINGKFEGTILQNTLQNYINRYVLCQVCSNPETTLSPAKSSISMTCAACGNVSQIQLQHKFDQLLYTTLSNK